MSDTSVMLLLIAGCTVAAMFLKNFFYAEGNSEAFQEYRVTHPPISDKEYLARCDQGISPEVALKVRMILSDATGIDEQHIYPDMTLKQMGAW